MGLSGGAALIDGAEKAVEQLLADTAAAHHQAFIQTDGVDPEWPLWYGTYLMERLPAITGFSGTRSELVYWVIRLDKEYQKTDSSIPWARFYAARLTGL